MNTPRTRPDIPLADELAGVFARMSGLLLSEDTVATSLDLLGALARETVAGSCGAGVSLIEGGRRTSAGSTDERVRQADALQYELDEGPCLAATAARELVVIEDLEQDPRWPRWSTAVTPLGLRSALSTPLVAGNTTLGAIKVYADHPRAFDARSRQLLVLFSAQAALLVANVQTAERARHLSEGMRQAVRQRDLVAMARGVLMNQHRIDEDTSLRMLMGRSQQKGVTLAEAARSVVESAVRPTRS